MISGAKSFNVMRHYKIHSAKYDWFRRESRRIKLESLKSARKQQTSMYKCNESDEITKTSYEMSHVLACNMKPYSDGEIMKKAIVLFAEECCSASIQLKAKKIQLSNDTVTRRIECISNDQRDHLFHESKNFVYCSVALDTSKDFTGIEQLTIFIRGVMPDFKICEKYLTLLSIHGSTKGTGIFREFQVTLKHWTHQSSLQWQPMGVLPCFEQIKDFKDSSTSDVKKMILLL